MSKNSQLSQNEINNKEEEDDDHVDEASCQEDFNQFQDSHQQYRHYLHSISHNFPSSNHLQQPYPMPLQPFVDPTLQLQFYEARMRDHAALYAQYASAAAGAAAQLSSSVPMYPSALPNPMPFYPPLNPSLDPYYGQYNGLAPVGYPSSSIIGLQQHHSHTYDSRNDGSRRDDYDSEEPNFTDANNKAKKQKRVTPMNQSHSYQMQQQALQSNIELNRRIRRRKDQVATSVALSNKRFQSAKLKSKPSSVHRGKRSKVLSSSNTLPDVTGKTAVRALYEICDKRRWSAPRFVEHDNLQTNDASSSSTYSHTDFIMSIIINGVELSRSRGASKKAAQQDAARKALVKLFPEAVFDIYGILIELGSVDRNKIFFDHVNFDRKVHEGGAVDIGEELAPSLASRLAIDGVHEKSRLSPAPSEDSSISSTVSMKRSKVSSVVTGGPLHDGKRRPKSLYPNASTTSGVSSASEEIDDDQYLATRGASVCSTLLNVMVQIDGRIRDQPTYSFDVCSNTPIDPPSSSKRKGSECNSDAMTSKRRSTTKNGKSVTLHQTSFSCTATLNLYERDDSNDANAEKEESKITVKCLKATGTGTTKRAARHVASAKLLELLFPECNGMAEVKAAAEAAQERNATKKVGKRTSQRPSDKFTKRSFANNDAPISKENAYIMSLFQMKPDFTLSEHLVQKLVSYCGEIVVKSKDPPGSALAKLSLTEPNDKITSFNNSDTLPRKRSRRERFEAAVDEALYEMHLQEDEVKASSGFVEENELGKTVIRRASIEDSKTIERLFEKIQSSKEHQDSSNLLTHISNDTVDVAKISKSNDAGFICRDMISIWNQDVVILILYRSEEALGCAVLSLGFSLKIGRTLKIIDIFHKQHYPKERFVDCLSSLAQRMNCKLEDRTIVKSKDVVLSKEFQKSLIEKHLTRADEAETERNHQDDQDHRTQELHRKPLQAVKEEDESDEDEKSDQVHKKRLKLE